MSEGPPAPRVPVSGPTAAGWSNRCHQLREDFDAIGDPALLDEAIQAGRKAMELTPEDHPWWARRLSNLSLALRARFEVFGRLWDLVESVGLAERAVSATLAGEPWLARLQSNLAAALRARHVLTGDRDDLVRAADLDQQALAAVDFDDPDRPGLLANLGLTHLETYQADRDKRPLEAAIRMLTAAVSLTPRDDPDRPRYLMNLAVAFRDWAELTGEVEAAEHAIAVGEQAHSLLPAGHPETSSCLSDLGRAHRVRAALAPPGAVRRTHAQRSIELRRQSSSVTTSPFTARALAARAWGEWSLEDGDQAGAVDGYATAVDLLAGVAWHGLERRSREVHLARWRGLGEDAAAAGVRAKRPGLAVVLLEQGRTVLWNESLDHGGDLLLLEQVQPAAAARLRAIRLLLDRAPVQ